MAEPVSISQLLEQAAGLLPADTARLDAEVLLAHALGKTRSHLHAWPEKHLSTAQQTQFQRLLQARLRGEPVAYLTGQREFWSLPLALTPATLIPRPETETLVALALEVIPADSGALIADHMNGPAAGCWQRTSRQLRLQPPRPMHTDWVSTTSSFMAATGVNH